ncbi:hypothetical protein [Halorarius litoreus]|uniref:hypothetical protein n=1 Tax=Halorarius litoreus TaxID=2962676 RepID=UPI0020CB97B3|nr:hypothetical protein [Halorarius litoreus]
MSESSVFAELQREMQETGTDLKALLQEAKGGDSSKSELTRELKQEAESTGQSLNELLDSVKQRAEENGRDVTEQLKVEYESFTSN